MPILPELATMGMRHWMTRGQRKQEADLAEREMSRRERQTMIAESQEARAVRMEPYLTKQIDAQIGKWNADNEGQIATEDNDMIKNIMSHGTKAADRGDIQAANQWMKVLRDNYPQLKGVGEIVYEPGEQEGDYMVSDTVGGKTILVNKATGTYDVIDISDEKTPVAKKFQDMVSLVKSTQAEMRRIDDKYKDYIGQGGAGGLVAAAADNQQGAIADMERYRKLEELHDDLTIEAYGGGSPTPQIPAPPKAQVVEKPTEEIPSDGRLSEGLKRPMGQPITKAPTASVSMEIPRASLPDTLRDKPVGTYAVLKDGRVLLVTEKGGRFLSNEEAEAWKAQRK